MINPRVQQQQQIIAQLTALLEARLPDAEAAKVCALAEQFFGSLPLESLQGSELEALYNSVLACWHHIQSLPSSQAKIAISNPDYEQHGWHSNHTVIIILTRDIPHLVDSVQMELNRQAIAIHRIDNAILRLERDAENRLVACTSPQDEGIEDAPGEALIYIEVDRHTDDQTLAAIEAGLNETLSQVLHAFTDSTAIAEKLQLIQDRIAQPVAGVTDSERTETARFIEWLRDGNFIFLGYDAYRIDPANDVISHIGDSNIGCMGAPDQENGSRTISAFSAAAREQLLSPSLLAIKKDHRRSRIYRPLYCNCLVFKVLDENGSVVGAEHFYGLFTASATSTTPEHIPLVRQRIAAILKQSAFPKGSHNANELSRILSNHPWDELLIARHDELFATVMGIFDLQERRRVRMFVRLDPHGQYASCIYYVPKDTYCTALRLRIQAILANHFEPRGIEFSTHYSESILSRTHFYLTLDPTQSLAIDPVQLERDVVQASHSWEDLLHRALVDTLGEETGNAQFYRYGTAFSSAYKENFLPLNGVYDIQHLNELDDSRALSMSFYRVAEQNDHILRFKLFSSGSSLMLSDVVPILENLGVQVDSEHPYKVRYQDGSVRWIHDYTLIYPQAVDVQMIKPAFQDTFAQVLAGTAENDELNRLVLGARLSCREVALLRAYSRYMRQLRKGYSQPYIASTLIEHPRIAKLLVSLFKARFAPKERLGFNRERTTQRIQDKIIRALEQVNGLGEDRILRTLTELIGATVRTNFFQRNAEGQLKDYFSFKLRPRLISDIAQPRPEFEVFVYSPRVEGVHLRFGKVARGGLRWSDRLEDFRTEVLGLVKAQRVKNAVIVPVGAKGGFVVKRPPKSDQRDEILNEGIACYKTFIRGLLDITDNIVEGNLIAPQQVVRHDEDDPYLVVAADKGTATFSDIANGIAEEYGFWLGDAFASGGSQGYDHKKMGITARGAWESVKRHFREKGLDTQTQPFSVVGIGDMAGDVFGNGMLLSPVIQLVAAFNHRHIFIDPTPDIAASYAERQRLFDLPGSAWSDYDNTLISAGGGIFSRAAKSIAISPQMKQRFGIEADSLAPNDLINALLKAQVDMIWNGGIGTYIKSSGESHAEVGDKNNDGIRVNGRQLRCAVFAEGGNLGATQLGRCEFASVGGAVNTDFIDNAGGVDCSDHEVNIKILLNGVVAKSDMTGKQRNELLKTMTEEVASQVLLNNYRQVQAISLSQAHSPAALDEYREFAKHLEDSGMLDRALEAIPEDSALIERKSQGLGLTRPELSVLISYAKGELKEVLMDSWIARDPHIAKEAYKAFPQTLVDGFSDEILNHQLHPQIVATQIANEIVNRMGPTFVHRLHRSTGAQYADIAAAYLVARDIFAIDSHWLQIEALDGKAAWKTQAEMMKSVTHLLARSSRWFLLNQENPLGVTPMIARFKQGMEKLLPHLPALFKSCSSQHSSGSPAHLTRQHAPAELAHWICGGDILFAFLEVINTAQRSAEPLDKVAMIFFGVGERLGLDRFNQAIDNYQPLNHWQVLARDTYLSDLTAQQSALTSAIMNGGSEEIAPVHMIESWKSNREPELCRWDKFSSDLFSTEGTDLSAFAVVIRELVELTKSSGRTAAVSS